ncbi:MAG: outer membrane beta-barrel domain-containing protein [Burkholderiaceae bacterium]|nr:outer membrane beta-barrel domain-containing protein [Burkholderiaceae bacterium]
MNKISPACVIALALLGNSSAFAQQTARPDGNQVVVPEVERREVRLPKFPSKDIAVGLFAGTYATQNFGAAAVVGARLGYHITEDWFVEATLGQSKVSDEAFRQVLPGGIFTDPKEKLTYYNFSAGYNLLPGEVFPTAKRAKATAIYLIAGVGSTKFNEQRSQTVNFGLGGRLLLADRIGVQVDMRDHVFSLDLLGKRQSTHNLELSAGFTYYF